jgi:hypothetical protein
MRPDYLLSFLNLKKGMMAEQKSFRTQHIMSYLFPFAQKFTYLKQYWWHRLFTVLYWFALVSILFWFFWLNQGYENTSYELCFRINLESNIEPIGRGCEVLAPHTLTNIGFALVATLITSYLLQLVYFRVFLYILGKKPMKL